MNTKNIVLTFFGLIWLTASYTQNTESITVPLSDPGKAGKLELIIQNGEIHVESHNRQDVLVQITVERNVDKHMEERAGLKRIPNNAIDVDISEYNNKIEIRGTNKSTDFKVMVPKNFSLVLSSHHNDLILVKGVNGDMELQSHHGSIELHDVSGSVVATTHHGGIFANFVAVEEHKPMAFSTYHGDIEVSFPSDFDGAAKIKSTRGEVFTDFEMSIKSSPLENDKTHERNEIKLGGWIIGQIPRNRG